MAEITNLNRFRKDKARAEKRAKAGENAVKFGRSKAQKVLDKTRAEAETARLEGHRREAPKADD